MKPAEGQTSGTTLETSRDLEETIQCNWCRRGKIF